MENSFNTENILGFFAAIEEQPTKILLQKFTYFLSYIGEFNQYDFEPHTYGPYSFELASDLKVKTYNQEISVENDTYKIIEKDFSKDSKRSNKLSQRYDQFLGIVEEKKFDNLEMTGTLMYCVKSLKYHQMPYSFDDVIKEFKGWKKHKYDNQNEFLQRVYRKVLELYQTEPALISLKS